MKRWASMDTMSPTWVRYHLKKFSDPSHQWDYDSAQDLLDMCSKIRIYCDIYYEIDRDLSEHGVNQNTCKRLVNYVSKFF